LPIEEDIVKIERKIKSEDEKSFKEKTKKSDK